MFFAAAGESESPQSQSYESRADTEAQADFESS